MGLSEEQVSSFRSKGFLVVEHLLTEEDLIPVIDEYATGWIDRKAHELAATGRLTALHADAPFERRTALLYAQAPEIIDGLDIMTVLGPATFAFMRNPRLLDAVESLIGPEIKCSPIHHVRAKPPTAILKGNKDFFNVPWHQDAGTMWAEADGSDIVTCWIPLVDANVENGCVEVMPEEWLRGYLQHVPEGGLTIRPDLVPDTPTLPMPVARGGVLFMHRHTPHRSTPNHSDHIRWSIDLRYQPTGTPTGRPFHPSFIARSRRDPDSELTDHTEWRRRWQAALANHNEVRAHRV